MTNEGKSVAASDHARFGIVVAALSPTAAGEQSLNCNNVCVASTHESMNESILECYSMA